VDCSTSHSAKEIPLEQAAVTRILLAERAKLLGYIWSLVRDEHLMEDVFQEVSLLAIEKCAQIYEEQSLWPWLRQTAKFRAMHALAAQGKSLALSEEVLAKLDFAWTTYDQRHSTDIVPELIECVSKLSAYSQRIISLRYVEGLSGIEVADRLKRQTKTIYMALSRIHNSLRQCLQERLSARVLNE
jgi:RNA polymerase sigma-70 factor (ECF subfamily)